MSKDNIKFSKYFNSWLYDENSYYANYKEIGKDGDFYTSVSVSSFFGGSIAKKIISSIEDGFLDKHTTIVEIGAHHGYLLADIIQFIYTLKPKLLDTLSFVIIEKFDNLQKQQKQYLKTSFDDKIKLNFYKNLQELELDNAFVLANEIFDSFACELVYTNKDNILEMAYVNNHKIKFEKCLDEDIINHCEKYKITKGEVCLNYLDFIQTLCASVKRFEFLSFDYGDNYARNDFSTRIYNKHKVYNIFEKNIDLKKLFALSDITYDVNFKHLIDIFKQHNCEDIVYCTQNKTLISYGIIDLLEILKNNTSHIIYLKEVQKVKTLLESSGMGDRFKSINVRKH